MGLSHFIFNWKINIHSFKFRDYFVYLFRGFTYMERTLESVQVFPIPILQDGETLHFLTLRNLKNKKWTSLTVPKISGWFFLPFVTQLKKKCWWTLVVSMALLSKIQKLNEKEYLWIFVSCWNIPIKAFIFID